MKIIRLDTNSSGHASLHLMADSVYRPAKRQPLFLPDEDCSIELRRAFRIGRLGKAIRPEFAPRYIDASTLVAYVCQPRQDATIADMADDSLIHGEWIEIGRLPEALPAPDSDFCSLLARISANTTMKTGDVIVLPDTVAVYSPATPGMIDIPGIISLKIV